MSKFSTRELVNHVTREFMTLGWAPLIVTETVQPVIVMRRIVQVTLDTLSSLNQCFILVMWQTSERCWDASVSSVENSDLETRIRKTKLRGSRTQRLDLDNCSSYAPRSRSAKKTSSTMIDLVAETGSNQTIEPRDSKFCGKSLAITVMMLQVALMTQKECFIPRKQEVVSKKWQMMRSLSWDSAHCNQDQSGWSSRHSQCVLLQ